MRNKAVTTPVSSAAPPEPDPSADPVLSARFAVPPLPDGFVRRPRLLKLVSEGLHRPLLLVNGPAGAGKSLLLADWIAAMVDRRAGPVIWLTAERDDDVPGVFFAHLLQALRSGGIAIPPDVVDPAGAQRVGRPLLVRLAAHLADLSEPVTVIIDQFERATRTDISDELDFLLTHAATGLRLVLISRTEPLLPLHRYRVSGQIAEIRGRDLEFVPVESARLLGNLELSLCEDAVRALTERTGGWAAGLRLSALAATRADDPEVYLKDFEAAETTIADFLLAEVLAQLSPEAQDLVLRTSILDQTHVELADALTGRRDAARLLDELAHANAFVEPIGHHCYRPHPLFAEILRYRLRARDPELEGELHRRAARWLADRGRLAEALPHAAAGGDWKFAADRFVESLSIGQLFLGVDADRLLTLFTRMPPDPLGAASDLVRAALALARRDVIEARPYLEEAERFLVDDRRNIAPAELTCALLRVLTAALTGSADDAQRSAAMFDAWALRAPVDLIARHPELFGLLHTALGSACMWEGRFDEARRAFDQAVELSPDTAATRQHAESHLALIDLMRGLFGRARTQARTAILDAERYGLPRSCTCVAHVVLARIAFEQDDLADARANLGAAAAASATATPDPITLASLAVTRSRLLLADGDPVGALDVLAPTRSIAWDGTAPGTPSLWARSEAAEARSAALLACGDAAAAAEVAAREAAHDPACAVALAHAQLAADADADPKALDSLDAVTSVDAQSAAVKVRGMLVRAQAAQCAGDEATAVSRLAQALAIARPERLRRPFRESDQWIRHLLQGHEVLARAHDWLPRETRPDRLRVVTPGTGSPDCFIEPLSAREHEVLEYAAEMMSTQEIADDLYLSVNTVKTHLKNINRKLCVTRRSEAVRRARQLQIL